jgi:hypothetical protein
VQADRALRLNLGLLLAILPLVQDLILDAATFKAAVGTDAKLAAADELAKDALGLVETVAGRDVVNDAAVLKAKDVAINAVRDFMAAIAEAKVS